MTIKIKAELEIDTERGVIYVHNTKTGATQVRISNLPRPIPSDLQLDITHGIGVNWEGKQTVNTEKG